MQTYKWCFIPVDEVRLWRSIEVCWFSKIDFSSWVLHLNHHRELQRLKFHLIIKCDLDRITISHSIVKKITQCRVNVFSTDLTTRISLIMILPRISDRQFFRRRFLFVDETLDKNLLVLCWCCCWATRKTVNRVILSSSCYIEDDALISFCLPVPLLRLQSGHHSRQDVLLSLLCSMIVDPPFIPNMGWHETPKKPSSRYWTVQESTWPRNWSLEHHERK